MAGLTTEESTFEVRNDSTLVCSSDQGVQIIASHMLKDRILHDNHDSLFVGRPDGCRRNHRIRKDYSCPAMTVICYATVRKCSHGVQNLFELRKSSAKLQLFPATAPLTSVCIDILREPTMTQRRNQYLFVITDRLIKMTKTVLMKGLYVAEMAGPFMNA